VIYTLSLHHHQDGIQALREAARVVKSNGRILVIEPLVDGEIERLFAILHDEDEDKLAAQKAVRESGLILIQSEIFHADWVFDSKEEMCVSVFEYYEVPYDPLLAREMVDLVAGYGDDSPLTLTDSMSIQVLAKNAIL